jgi:ABC-type Na+ efflux pump permease subunit
MGLISLTAGVLIGIYLTFVKLVYRADLVDRPLLLLAFLLVLVGLHFITMGLLGEMIARTYHESQNKPFYIVRVELG